MSRAQGFQSFPDQITAVYAIGDKLFVCTPTATYRVKFRKGRSPRVRKVGPRHKGGGK